MSIFSKVTKTPSPATAPQAAKAPAVSEEASSELAALSYEQGANALKPAEQVGFFDKVKAKLGLGRQLTQHKAGTREASNALAGKMASSHGQRAQRLVQILAAGANNDPTFDRVSSELAGGDLALLGELYAALAPKNESLPAGIGRVFGDSSMKARYLNRVMTRGEPDLICKLAMATGCVTHTKAMPSEITRLVEEADPHEFKAALLGTEGFDVVAKALERTEYLGLFKGRQQRAVAAGDAKLREIDHTEALASQDAKPEAVGPAWRALVAAKSEQLCAMYRQRWSIGRGIARKALVEDIQRICGGWDTTLRRAVVAPGEPFANLILAESKHWNIISRTGAATGGYLVALIAEGAEPPAEFFAAATNGAAAPQERDATQEVDVNAVGSAARGVIRDLERKKSSKSEVRHLKLGVGMKYTTIEDKISAMSTEERQDLLLGYLTPAERDAMLDPEAEGAAIEAMRKTALDRFEAHTLAPAGMKAEEIVRFRGAFAHGASRDGHKYASPYSRLRALAASPHYHVFFGRQAVRYASKLSGSEILEVVRDEQLLTTLKKRIGSSAGEQWKRLCALLGYDPDVAAAPHRGPSSAGLSVAHREGRKGDGQSERALAANMAELQPAHWAAKLNHVLEGSGGSRATHKAVMMVNGAVEAAQRRAALPEIGRAVRATDVPSSLAPTPATTFCQQIGGGLSATARFRWQTSDDLGAARTALRTATPVSAAAQIEATRYGELSLHHVTGRHLNKSSVLDAIKRAHGVQLLKQWSNYNEWKSLHNEAISLRNTYKNDSSVPKLAMAERRLEGFTLDVSGEVHAALKAGLPTDEHVSVLGELRDRLADAMANDSDFKANAKELETGRFEQEKTRALGQLEKQHLNNSGAQWTTLSSASPLAKESGHTMVGRVRSGHRVLQTSGKAGGVTVAEGRQKVNEEIAPKIAESREELGRRQGMFEAVQANANKAAIAVVGMVVGAILTAIATGTSILTFGGAAPLWAGMLFAAGVAVGTAAAAAGVRAALEGDRFNAQETLAKATVAVVIATASAGISGVLPGAQAGMDLATAVGQEVLQSTAKAAVSTALKTTYNAGTETDTSKIPGHILSGITDFLTNISGAALSSSIEGGVGMLNIGSGMSKDVGGLVDKGVGAGGKLLGKATDKAQEKAASAAVDGGVKVYDTVVRPTYTVQPNHGDLEQRASPKLAAAQAARITRKATAAGRGTIERGERLIDQRRHELPLGDEDMLQAAFRDLATAASEAEAGLRGDVGIQEIAGIHQRFAEVREWVEGLVADVEAKLAALAPAAAPEKAEVTAAAPDNAAALPRAPVATPQPATAAAAPTITAASARRSREVRRVAIPRQASPSPAPTTGSASPSASASAHAASAERKLPPVPPKITRKSPTTA